MKFAVDMRWMVGYVAAVMNAYLSIYTTAKEIRAWNARFSVPPVCTVAWDESDWQRWEASRKPLPEFAAWLNAFKPETVNVTAFGKTTAKSRKFAANYLRALRHAGGTLTRERVRSAVGITCAFPDGLAFVSVSYKSNPLEK